MYFAIKTLLSALVIAGVTELSERSQVAGAFLKSLPLTSYLVFLIMRFEKRPDSEIVSMSWDILYLVIPSLLLFIVFPILLSRGVNFYLSLLLATMVMAGGYGITLKFIS